MSDVAAALGALDNMTRVLKAFEGARAVLTALQSADETAKSLAKRIADSEKELTDLGIELAGVKQKVAEAKADAKDIRDKAKAEADAKIKAAGDAANKRVENARTEAHKVATEAAEKLAERDALVKQIDDLRKVIRGLEQTRNDMKAAVDAIIARAAAPAAVEA